MKKLTNLLKESNFKPQPGKVYSNLYAKSFIKENDEESDNEQGLSDEQKAAFFEAVKQYRKFGESVYRNAGLSEVYEAIKNMVETASKVTLSETGDWFDGVTVSRHMKRMGESFNIFEKTLKEVSTLQQRLESSYDEIGEVLGKYYEINEMEDEIEEGNEFGAARAKAIAAGNDSFEVDGKTYPVKDVDKDDKENAKEFSNESMKLTDMIKGKLVNEITYDNAMVDFNKELEKNSEVIKAAKHYKKSTKDVVKALQSKIKVNRYSDKSIKQISINYTEDGPLSSKVTIKLSKDYKQNESVNESPSSEEIRIAMLAVNKQKKYRQVPPSQAVTDVQNALDVIDRDIKKGKIKDESVNEAGDFAGWIAIFNGKKLEIDKSQAKDLYNAKLFAIKTLKVPKSKVGMLAIKPAVSESVVNEAKVGDFEIGDFIHFKSKNKTGMVVSVKGNTVTINTPKGKVTGDIKDVQVLYQDNVNTSVKESVVNEAKYDIGMARKGNGITVYNRAEEEKGDYKNIAHISDNGVVKYYDKKLPNDVKKKIEAEAQKMKESVTEGKRRFNTKYGVGKSKYVINYHDGVKKHKDGSDFFDIEIFKNQKDLEAFKKALLQKGFVAESVNEGKSMKLTDMLNESFGFGELPSSKLMKMKVSAKDMLDSVNPKKVNEVYEEEDVVEEGRASAKSLLQSVIKGESSRIEGIKLSKEAAEGLLDWLMVSPYGKKFSNLPFHMLLKASFNWGLHRYIDKNSKEYKDLQAVAKTLEKK